MGGACSRRRNSSVKSQSYAVKMVEQKTEPAIEKKFRAAKLKISARFQSSRPRDYYWLTEKRQTACAVAARTECELQRPRQTEPQPEH